MKRLFKTGGFIFVVTLIALSAAFGQAAVSPAPLAALAADGPRIQFGGVEFDFGKVKPTDALRHEFIFTNTGNAALEITGVRPACGCTTAGDWDRLVQPGQTGKIPIQFNPGSFNGTVTKLITVTCNDALQNVHSLHVRATVWRPIDVQPLYAYFTVIEGESTNETKTVRITSNMDEPLTLEPPQSSSPGFRAELKAVRPGKEFALNVTYEGTVSNAARQGHITLKTSSTNMPTISLTTYAMSQPALMTIPQRVQLPAGTPAVNHRATVIVRNNGSKPVELSDAQVNAEGVTVQTQETQKGKAFNLSLSFPPEFQVSAGKAVELTVKTTHRNYPVLRVPIVSAASLTPVRPAPSSTSAK